MILEQSEENVLGIMKALNKKGQGAHYRDLIEFVEKRTTWGIDLLEEQVSHLIDVGLLYEPILGYLKVWNSEDVPDLDLDPDIDMVLLPSKVSDGPKTVTFHKVTPAQAEILTSIGETWNTPFSLEGIQ